MGIKILYSEKGDGSDYEEMPVTDILRIINEQGDRKVEDYLGLRERALERLGL